METGEKGSHNSKSVEEEHFEEIDKPDQSDTETSSSEEQDEEVGFRKRRPQLYDLDDNDEIEADEDELEKAKGNREELLQALKEGKRSGDQRKDSEDENESASEGREEDQGAPVATSGGLRSGLLVSRSTAATDDETVRELRDAHELAERKRRAAEADEAVLEEALHGHVDKLKKKPALHNPEGAKTKEQRMREKQRRAEELAADFGDNLGEDENNHKQVRLEDDDDFDMFGTSKPKESPLTVIRKEMVTLMEPTETVPEALRRLKKELTKAEKKAKKSKSKNSEQNDGKESSTISPAEARRKLMRLIELADSLLTDHDYGNAYTDTYERMKRLISSEAK